MRRWLWLVGIMLLMVGLLPGAMLGTVESGPAGAQSRPKLSGPEETYGTPHFVIHYTHVGVDAVSKRDADGSGTPDWVEEVGRVMEAVWQVVVGQHGWPAPIADQGEGGDSRFDVYLMELFNRNVAGYVSPSGGRVGDNPATPRQERDAAYGYMVLENDFIDPNPPPGLKVWEPEDWLRIIAAHEFTHASQIGITGTHAMNWWYESTANWMETQVFPHLPDNLTSARAVFKSPDTCLLRFGGVNRVESGLHWYGMWVFNQSLAEQHSTGIIRDIWLAMGDRSGYRPFDDVFAAYGTTFDDELRRFALNVLLRNFVDGDRFPTARLQESVDAPGEWAPMDGVQRYSMDYIGLDLDAPYTVTLDSSDPGVEGIVVGVDGGEADIYPPSRNITVDFDRYDDAYLVVLNLTRPPNEAGCATARYSYAVQAAAGDPVGAQYVMGVPYFDAPRVESVTDPEDIPLTNPFYQTEYDVGDEIDTVDLPFDPVVPRGEPAGYELDSVYGIDADAQGAEFVSMLAPSGGTVAQMVFFNSAGRMMRLTESRAIYTTIGEWMAVNDLEFKPGVEVWTTGNIDTAVIRRDGGCTVTFIVKNRFVAIDGDATRDEMLDMAARFAASTDW